MQCLKLIIISAPVDRAVLLLWRWSGSRVSFCYLLDVSFPFADTMVSPSSLWANFPALNSTDLDLQPDFSVIFHFFGFFHGSRQSTAELTE